LVDLPRIGRVVPEMNDPAIREIILGNYRIIYRLHTELAEILTVHNGTQLLDPRKLN
jgi:plasmid stabilization system protein ParE